MRAFNTLGICVAACLLLGSRGGCGGEPENAYIMSQMHLVTSGEPEAAPAGFTCADVSAGSGSLGQGSPTDDFWMQEESNASGLAVEIGSLEQTLASRFYDRAFIAAHAVDRFVVTTQGGDQYAFVYWGGDSCEDCPPLPSKPMSSGDLPGGPFRCERSE